MLFTFLITAMASPVGEVKEGYQEYDPRRALPVLHAQAEGVDLNGVIGEIRLAHQPEHRCSRMCGSSNKVQFNPNIILH